MKLSPVQIQAISTFISHLSGQYNLEQILAAGEFWAKNSDSWKPIKQSGSGQIALVCWYNYTHKPGANEWKPAVIIVAALACLKKPFSTNLLSQSI